MNQDVILTKDGLEELKKELEERKETIREKIAQDIKRASEQGDLSENAAYRASMEEKEFNENRISDLEKLISRAVVEKVNKKDSKAGLGERVMVRRKSDGAKREYVLVGDNEADPSQYKISIDSPIGQSLHGRKVGDSVMVQMPNGEEEFEILEVK
ncbi:MAG: Transcription elongation factor GreA [candidate division WS6 bacterium GW2011_GWA2_37_6]|uniref:Transcription elongation factor GreA n=1 Tax=candidate division WS6 bacterium GW2011_GWA2_37_6 TaxID=1619087 RepID=A0A0G0H289_9BACT|nr:MAG: Transcription elongation factor GreA [candidate division WS6 bacterium GW2011_GWA2_37_6]